MESTAASTIITVQTTVNAPIEKIWEAWTKPEHVTKWNHASDDWHSPHGENDLREGGKFSFRMEARDGSLGFDFGGVYDEVREHELIRYTMGDGRKVQVDFVPEEDATRIVESFEAESTHSQEMQKDGWQAILDNYRKYVESL